MSYRIKVTLRVKGRAVRWGLPFPFVSIATARKHAKAILSRQAAAVKVEITDASYQVLETVDRAEPSA